MFIIIIGKECKLEHLENGAAKDFKTSSDEYSVYYRCKPEFTLDGKPIQRCLASGEWSGDVPECKMESKI